MQEKTLNLFAAARNAREAGDDITAIKHYEEISALEPNNWEALFYLTILKTNTVKYGEISNAAISVINCLPKVFELINTTIDDEEIKKDAVKMVTNQCNKTAAWLIRASGNYYNSITKNDPSFSIMVAAMNMDSKRHARYESAQRMVQIGNILCACGNCIEKTFGLTDEFYNRLAVDCWKAMLISHFEHIKLYKVAVFNDETIQKYATKIQKYDSSYVIPNIKPTEKRDYAIKGIIIALIALGIGLLIALPMLNLYF
ncbi:MAG: hypothetical protein IKJ93_01045 [Clostridia bacterium]|nr:hypothetical protein [Clostridia bacterium]